MNTTLERKERKKIILDSFESDCLELDYDNFKEDFEIFCEKELNEYGYFLKGTIHRWDGKKLGHSKVCYTPQDLHNYILNYDYIKISVEYDEDNKQHLMFYLTHHDGTHTMELFSITKDGEEYLEENDGYINSFFINSEKFYKPVSYIQNEICICSNTKH